MLIVFNIIGGLIAIVAITFFFINWLKAEKKLAKYEKSTLFEEKKSE